MPDGDEEDGDGRRCLPVQASLPPVGSVPLDDPQLLRLVDRERWRRDATGALIGSRPPADIAYRLAAWYRVPGVTVGQVAELLQRIRTPVRPAGAAPG